MWGIDDSVAVAACCCICPYTAVDGCRGLAVDEGGASRDAPVDPVVRGVVETLCPACCCGCCVGRPEVEEEGEKRREEGRSEGCCGVVCCWSVLSMIVGASRLV